MKIIYDSYADIMRFTRQALRGLVFGVGRTLWSVVLFIINTAVFAFRKAAAAIKRKPVTVVIVLLFILVASNLAIYASMKCRLNTAEWQYDKLRMHMDSVYEIYNIHNSYSRVVSYGE